MSSHKASPKEVQEIETLLAKKGLTHLRATARGASITLASGKPTDPVLHAKFTRRSQAIWQLAVATHTGRWEQTPLLGSLAELCHGLVDSFGWLLEPLDDTANYLNS